MSNTKTLPVIDFYCKKCDAFQVVRTIGVVINGPVCKICRRPMRRVQIVQTTLGLSLKSDSKGGRTR